MANNRNYVKVSTPIRTIRSDIGQLKISLFNDQISFNIQPATGKTEYGGIKYNGAPQVAPNVRFSVGVAAAISDLIKNKIIPAAEAKENGKRWEVFACKRNNYEAYLGFEIQNGIIGMTGTEINNGMRKQASYTFPPTIITDGDGNTIHIQGEAMALADLLSEIGAGNEMPLHMRQYNQAVKDNMPNGGYDRTVGNANNNASQQNTQAIGNWRPF